MTSSVTSHSESDLVTETPARFHLTTTYAQRMYRCDLCLFSNLSEKRSCSPDAVFYGGWL